MKKNNELSHLEPAELMLMWNRYCDAHGKEGDCILLNEDRTYVEAFGSEEQAMKEILNSTDPEFKRNEGFLVPVYDNERYVGMRYVPFDRIGEYIDLVLCKCLISNGGHSFIKTNGR